MTDVFDNAGQLDTTLRLPDLPIGDYTVTIRDMRRQSSSKSGRTNLIVTFDTPRGPASWATSLEVDGWGKQKGVVHMKRIVALALGLEPEGDAARALGKAELTAAVSAQNPHAGAPLRVVCSQGKPKAAPQTGHYVEAHFDAARTAAPPVTPPPAAPPVDADAGWFDFAASDRRHGKRQYNAAGETRAIA